MDVVGQGKGLFEAAFGCNLVSSLTNGGFSINPLCLSYITSPLCPSVERWTQLSISPKAQVPPSSLPLLSAGKEPQRWVSSALGVPSTADLVSEFLPEAVSKVDPEEGSVRLFVDICWHL